MKAITIHYGNLLDSQAQVIAHQANCLGLMGAGVALAIRNKWPEVFEKYQDYCCRRETEPSALLGTAQPVLVSDGRFVMNLFGQLGVRRSAGQELTNYVALETSMQWTASWMKSQGLTTIAMPYMIGCGLGGGNWDTVLDIIHRVFDNTNISVELWQL